MPEGPLGAIAANPFLIHGPAVVSFSGGRTSAYMLWRVLQAHGGTMPSDVLVCFANTGREMPATLDFVARCASEWGIHVHWLEYRHEPLKPEEAAAWREARAASVATRLVKARSAKVKALLHRQAERLARTVPPGRVWAEEVSYDRASRNGEPFEALLRQRSFLPNPVSRFCTTELKIRTIRRYCVQRFGPKVTWLQVVGLRADEPSRVERMLDPARQKKAGRESRNVALPLAAAGVTKADVLAFWRAQSFDLMLRGAWEGNCDGCFLKRKSFITRLAVDHPERAAWWVKCERELRSTLARRPEIAQFRKDWKGGYAAIVADAAAAPRLLPDPEPEDFGEDPGLDCDSARCGV